MLKLDCETQTLIAKPSFTQKWHAKQKWFEPKALLQTHSKPPHQTLSDHAQIHPLRPSSPKPSFNCP